MRSKRLKTQSKVVSTNGCDTNSSDCKSNTATKNGTNNETSDHMSDGQHITHSIEYSPKLCLRCHCKHNGINCKQIKKTNECVSDNRSIRQFDCNLVRSFSAKDNP